MVVLAITMPDRRTVTAIIDECASAKQWNALFAIFFRQTLRGLDPTDD